MNNTRMNNISGGTPSNGLEIADMRTGESATWPNWPRSAAGLSASRAARPLLLTDLLVIGARGGYVGVVVERPSMAWQRERS